MAAATRDAHYRKGCERRDARNESARCADRERARSTAALAFSERRVEVRCAECRNLYTLSVRRELEHRRTGRPSICSLCRRPPHPKPTEADREWWLERFSLEELVELADAIWEPR